MSDAKLLIQTLLMPISQAVAWCMILRQPPLLSQVWKVAFFYFAWAIYNRYVQGVKQELGHISTGLLALAAYTNHPRAAIAGTVLVLLNFLVALVVALPWNAHDMAAKIKKRDDWLGMTWARTFKLYALSSVTLWGVVLRGMLKD